MEILRDELLGWLAGTEEDLETDRLPDPGAVARDADAFRRLLTALDRGEIELPDDDAREAMSRAAEGYDDASGYERVSPSTTPITRCSPSSADGLLGRVRRRHRRAADQAHPSRLDMSQEALADNTEIHRTQMTGIEWGERLPRIDTLIKLAGGLGISPCELLDGIVWEVRGSRQGRMIEVEGGGDE
jgi:DNA-binding XRE family transcriptional regulator